MRKPALFQPQEKTVQMNVRINRSDKLRFEKHCRSRGLNQRQGFALLLETDGERRIYREQAKKIERLLSERDKLRTKIDDLEGHGSKEGAAQAYLALLIPGLKRYFEAIRPWGEPDSPVPRMSLDEFKRKHADERQYRYPEKEGFYQILPVAATWGRKKVWFLFCLGEKREKYRLRTYPREDYVGYSFREPLPVGQGISTGCAPPTASSAKNISHNREKTLHFVTALSHVVLYNKFGILLEKSGNIFYQSGFLHVGSLRDGMDVCCFVRFPLPAFVISTNNSPAEKPKS